MEHLIFKIGCTPQELRQAQALRYQVFNCEIKGVPANGNPAGLDRDKFDDICEHLIVIDTAKNMVVGTYRMLLDTIAGDNDGFYSETKFNIENLKALNGRLLEVGRSCVHKDYRNNVVMTLLWHGIAEFIMRHRVRYLFGSANIMTDDRKSINRFFAMFKALGLYEDMGITARNKNLEIKVDNRLEITNPQKLFKELPVLFKAYLKLGLKVCGHPVKGDFRTALFPVFFDVADTTRLYKRHFLGNYPESLIKKT